MHLTIVDDNIDSLDFYRDILEDSFELKLISDPLRLIDFITENHTDCLLLDVHMPVINGLDLYKKYKKQLGDTPVIFLTGDDSEENLLLGLNLGADDFLVKPLPSNQLIARIKNKINKAQEIKSSIKKSSNETINQGDLTLLITQQIVELSGQKISLTPIEFKLITLFMKKPNTIFSREFITNYIWPNIHVQNQNIDTHISNLRKKLHPFSNQIKTIKSRGYILRV